LAAAIAEREWGDGFRISSAGIAAAVGQVASGHARSVAERHGLDLGAHRARGLADVGSSDGELFVAMTASHREALVTQLPDVADTVVTLAELAGSDEDVADPFGGDEDDYERCYVQIARLVSAAEGEARLRATASTTNSPAGSRKPEPTD